MKLDKETGFFKGEFRLDTKVDAPTLIYANHKSKGTPWYPNGYVTKVTD